MDVDQSPEAREQGRHDAPTELVPLPTEFVPDDDNIAMSTEGDQQNAGDATAAELAETNGAPASASDKQPEDQENAEDVQPHGVSESAIDPASREPIEEVEEVEEVEEAEEVEERGKADDGSDRPDDHLRTILAALTGGKDGDGDADADAEAEEAPQESALSSPLSDVPDLPNVPFSINDTAPSSPSPPPSAAPTATVPAPKSPLPAQSLQLVHTDMAEQPSQAGPSRLPHLAPTFTSNPASASTSISVADRIQGEPERSLSPRVNVNGRGPSVTNAKRKRQDKPKPVDSEADPEDDLESISDVDSAPSKSKQKAKGKGKEKLQNQVAGVSGNGDEVEGDESENVDVDGKDGTSKGTKKRRKGEDGKTLKSAKSRKMLDHSLGIKADAVHPEKITPRAKNWTEAALKEFLKGKSSEIQVGACLRPRYIKWGKCTQCVAKQGGDACRFRDFRHFRIDPETAEILGPGYFESTEWKDPMTALPKTFNSPMTEDHLQTIERTIAPLLLPLISRELRHVVHNKAIKRGMDAARHRSVCDFCASTMFGGWWFCRRCGRDYCLVCERYFSDSMDTMTQSPWSLPDAARPRLLRCNGAAPLATDSSTTGDSPKKPPAFHFRPDLQPVSRFSEEELRSHWLAFADFVLEGKGGVGEKLQSLGLTRAGQDAVQALQDWSSGTTTTTTAPKVDNAERDATPRMPNSEDPSRLMAVPDHTLVMTPEEVHKLYTRATNPFDDGRNPDDPAGLENDSLEFIHIHDGKLSDEVFDLLWGRGEPMVVSGVGEKLKMSWTPDDFIERFGAQTAVVVNCQTDQNMFQNVGVFFNKFKDRANRSQAILKLKDWPETEDFAKTHPELYHDFCDALPVPDYTRREGVLNLYSSFPPGPTRPDIGPKMYNAFEARQDAEGKGSTSLHMDVADAINVMLYASPQNAPAPGSGRDRVNNATTKPEPIVTETTDSVPASAGNGGEVKDDKSSAAVNGEHTVAKGEMDEKHGDVLKNDDVRQTEAGSGSAKANGDEQNIQVHTGKVIGNGDVERSTNGVDESATKPDDIDTPGGAHNTEEEMGDTPLNPHRKPLAETEAIPVSEPEPEPEPAGPPGCAVWDIFRAEDADKIREFLTKRYNDTHVFTDPIHSQLFYLHAGLRRELYQEYGVVSWRIYQYPGQAVFIPAGCAHQVCNLADCIKIAVDFVSPHNVGRCQQLTQDFRTENFVKAWKDDVLQLYNVLWYAWQNTREIRQGWKKEARAQAAAAESRRRYLDALANGQHPADPEQRDGGESRNALNGMRSSSGFLGPLVSSARDEEAPSVSSIRSGTVEDNKADQPEKSLTPKADVTGEEGHTQPKTEEAGAATPRSVTPVDTGEGRVIDSRASPLVKVEEAAAAAPKVEDEDYEELDEHARHRRSIGEKLLAATLAMAEGPPPPEARKPSAATKWTSKPIPLSALASTNLPLGSRKSDRNRTQPSSTSGPGSRGTGKRSTRASYKADLAVGAGLGSAVDSVTAALIPPPPPPPSSQVGESPVPGKGKAGVDGSEYRDVSMGSEEVGKAEVTERGTAQNAEPMDLDLDQDQAGRAE